MASQVDGVIVGAGAEDLFRCKIRRVVVLFTNTSIPRLGALDVENAARHQVTGVHPVVVAEGEALHLGVEGEAELVGDKLAHCLP